MGIYRLLGRLLGGLTATMTAYWMVKPLPIQAVEMASNENRLELLNDLLPQFSNVPTLNDPIQAEFSKLSASSTQMGSPVAQVPAEIPRDGLPSNVLPRDGSPSERLSPLEELQPSSPPEDLLEPTAADRLLQREIESEGEPLRIFVERFEVVSSTVFDADDLATLAWQSAVSDSDEAITKLIDSYCPKSSSEEDSPDTSEEATETLTTNDDRASPTQLPDAQAIPETGRELSFAQLLQARSSITQLYIECGYITSGAILPPQDPEDGVVQLQVIEGSLEAIDVLGVHRLDPSYVKNRLALATTPPLNQQRLLEGLQLLQLDPLIQRLSAELQAGVRPSTNILEVIVTEADPFSVDFIANNNRSPSVGSFSRGLRLNHANVVGLGDGLSVAYANTEGSNEVDVSYTIPLNARNGTLRLGYGDTNSRVIEPPFDTLDIRANSQYYELTYRQPLYQAPTEEFALALTFSRQESRTRIGFDDIGPAPIAPGADEDGRTEISAIRFTQEWLKRDGRRVLAARSQLSLGVDLFGTTINAVGPDSQFFAWRGQGQWVQLLNPDTLLLIRADVQLAPDPLLPLEQFGLGGQDTIRGYREDALLTDNGVLASAEVRLPILRASEIQGVLQVAPFIDVGTGWNVESKNPDPNTLVSAGLGLLWRQSDDLTARLDWGIPLVSNNTRKRTWQESGVYFSLVFNTF